MAEWRNGEFTIIDEPSRMDFGAICRLLAGTYWAKDRAENVIKTSIQNSLSFALFKGNVQVGFARVVTDRATVGYLCDVVIADTLRGSGLGKWLLTTVLEHPDLAGCRIDLFTRDAQDFYRQYGFGPHRFTSMVRYPDGYAGGVLPGSGGR
jgi:ribosomal protein S18 acetylase RimI-like enzyme